jgi:hypothetical protein
MRSYRLLVGSVFCLVFCRSLFALSSFFFWPLYCLFVFHWFTSSGYSYLLVLYCLSFDLRLRVTLLLLYCLSFDLRLLATLLVLYCLSFDLCLRVTLLVLYCLSFDLRLRVTLLVLYCLSFDFRLLFTPLWYIQAFLTVLCYTVSNLYIDHDQASFIYYHNFQANVTLVGFVYPV